MDAKVDEAVKQVAKLETETSQKIEAAVAKAAGGGDALKADCEELGKMELQESEKDGAAHDEELKKIQNAQRDLYCGLYCTSRCSKEDLSVENKLEDLSRSGLSSSGRHDETYGEQPHQVETDLDDLQKKVQQLQVSVESSAEEMRSEFSSSIHQMKEHAAAEVEMLSATFRDNLSKIAQDNEESEEKKAREMELIEEKLSNSRALREEAFGTQAVHGAEAEGYCGRDWYVHHSCEERLWSLGRPQKGHKGESGRGRAAEEVP